MWISIVFMILAGISKSVADTISHHFYESVFSTFNPRWWNPEISWMNKGSNIFLRSILVGFTDAWHMFGTTERLALILGAFLAKDLIHLGILYGVFFTTFHVFYHYIFKR